LSLQGSLSRRATSLTSHEELHAGKAQRASTGLDGAKTSHRLPIRTLVAASVGNAVEWYDWTIYATFSIYFATQIFSAENESLAFILTFTTYALAFFFRPLGGFLLGRYADLKGRKQAMLLTIMLMAGGSLVIAILPTYAAVGWLAPILLLLARIAQGMSLGGEVSSASAYRPPASRGWAIGSENVTITASIRPAAPRTSCVTAEVMTGAGVRGIRRDGGVLTVETDAGPVSTRHLINCAGLHSDRVAALMGIRPEVQIIPFRGEYYMLKPERRSLVRGLIYPVPDPRFPFLGVHFTRTVHGDVEAGPNAVLALAREGYTIGTVRPAEALRTFMYRGFWNMGRRYWKMGAYEVYRSVSKAAFVTSLQRLVPGIQASDIAPGGAGVRAQAVSPDGSLVDDFKISVTDGAIHVLNAPSPAATASLAIGRHIAGLAAETFKL